MPEDKSIYKPREDSALLETYVRQYAFGSVLDMGTGSGIQAVAASKSKKVKEVLALDIDKSAVEHCKSSILNKKIKFLVSDLFEVFEKDKKLKNRKFDSITFNPPYLPQELKVMDLTLEGGKKGYEILEKFLNNANAHLKPDGIILIVFSSLTKKEKINEFIEKNLLEFELLETQSFFFEELYVYKIKKSGILKELERNGLKNPKYFAKGKRGLIYTSRYKNKKAAVKVKNSKSMAMLRIENEIEFLKLLNKKGIGPKLLLCGKDFFACEFVEGIDFISFVKKNKKNEVLNATTTIFNQLFKMDKLGINKEEMSHPAKHIIITKKNKPVLIDFERTHYVKRPSNVTQFCDFLISKGVKAILENKSIITDNKKMINLAKIYKKNISKGSLNDIVKVLT